MIPIEVPKLGVEDADAMVVEWIHDEGDMVESDTVIAIIETDKIEHEVASPATGILHIEIEEGVPLSLPVIIGKIEPDN